MVVRETGAPSAMRLENVPDPTPAPHDVIINVAACGVCFHDIVTRNGTLKAGVTLPFIPGHEVAGTVAAIGNAVTGFRVGDRVATTQRFHICGHCGYCRSAREPLCREAQFLGDAGLNGGYAEYVAVEADNVALIPDGVNFEDASIAACAIGTQYHAIATIGNILPGETVLVTGAGGGLGIHGVQLAHAMGAYVIALTTTPGKVAAIKQAGAQEVVVAKRGEDFSPLILDLTHGSGVNAAIDNVGSPVFRSVRKALAPGARWMLVGQLTGEFVSFNPAQLFLRGISMLSATSTTRDELGHVLKLLATGSVRSIISEKVALEAAAAAHIAVEGGVTLGRLILGPAA
jgi:D-arabinose 1-dehydrogenase-like Zn-dependent alcohol dehydrogenase